MAWAGQLRRACAAALLLACAAAPKASAQQAASPQATTIFTAKPSAVAYDQAGNLYVALQNDHSIRKVDVLGAITIVAGTGEQGFGGDGGPATQAQLDSPTGIAVDSSGALYIADTHNHRIRRVLNGTIATIAGTGIPGYAGDGGPATAAQLDGPAGLSVDGNGSLYIADANNQVIRKLSGSTIVTVAGTGVQGFSGENGAATQAQLDTPTGVAADPATAGQFYIADRHNHRLRVVNANGIITTVAGTGLPSFAGDNGPGAAAALNRPRGVAVDAASGRIYIADTDNQRLRVVSGGVISTVAGDGEQGFAGDIGVATAAVLDTPSGPAVSLSGVLSFADTHNQRVRSVAATQSNTVVGIAPPLSEALSLSGPTAGVYGSFSGQLTALFLNGNNQATGAAALYRDGALLTTKPFAANSASFDLSGTPGGLHTFAVLFAGDTINAPATSGVYLVNVSATQQTVTFPALSSPVTYAAGLSSTLNASSSSGLSITYSATGPATVNGSTLTYTGPGTVVVTAMQAGNGSYAPASLSQQVTVLASTVLTITGLAPGTVTLGVGNVTLTVQGSGFSGTSVVLLNGTALPTTFVSSTVLTATLPPILKVGTASVTVSDSSTLQTSSAAGLTVTAPSASAQLAVPATSGSAQQPTIALQLQTAYPVPISGVLTLTFVADGSLAVDDPNIQFSSGGRTLNFTIPANTTTVPAVAVQTGTVAGVITVSLSLTAQGVDVTPASARVATILIPRQPPVMSITFTQTDGTLTVVAHGYSNTRDMVQAVFNFTAAPGTNLSTTSLTVPGASLFSSWYSDSSSVVEGSVFTYTQIFQLSDSGSKVGAVGLLLTNSAGVSTQATTP